MFFQILGAIAEFEHALMSERMGRCMRRRSSVHFGGGLRVSNTVFSMSNEERGDDEAAFRRGDERGDGGAASALGILLERRGDLAGAEAAFRRGDERGDGAAAHNLGLLLERRGDLLGAEAAFQRAATSEVGR